MVHSGRVLSVGAVCFGLVVGYVTYRSLARSGPTSSVSDIAAVVGVVGGGVVTTVFGPGNSDSFGWYSIGLLAGMALYVVIVLLVGDKVKQKTEDTVFLGGDPRTKP